MIELHRNNGHQVATDPLKEIHRLIEDSEQRPIEPRAFGPRSNKSPHQNWEMPAISQGGEETSTSTRMKFQTLDFSCRRSRSGFFSKSLFQSSFRPLTRVGMTDAYGHSESLTAVQNMNTSQNRIPIVPFDEVKFEVAVLRSKIGLESTRKQELSKLANPVQLYAVLGGGWESQ